MVKVCLKKQLFFVDNAISVPILPRNLTVVKRSSSKHIQTTLTMVIYSSSTSLLSIYLIFNTINQGAHLILHLSQVPFVFKWFASREFYVFGNKYISSRVYLKSNPTPSFIARTSHSSVLKVTVLLVDLPLRRIRRFSKK